MADHSLRSVGAAETVLPRGEVRSGEASQEWQATLDLIPVLAWRTRPDGFTEYLNKRWLDYTGMAKEQALGWQWLAAVHHDDLADLSNTWGKVLASGKPGQAEARMRRFDGVYRWFLFRAEPLCDENGAVTAWYGTNTDIEDRKSAEEVVLRGARRYRQLFHYLPIALWHFNLHEITGLIHGLRASGVKDLSAYLDQNPATLPQMLDALIVEDVNDSAVKMSGAKDRGDLLERCGSLWARNPQVFRRAIESWFRDEAVFQQEAKFVTLAGREIAVLFVTARLEQVDEKPLSLVGLIDITERSHAQEHLRQAQGDFAHAARISMLGELTATIAHEVNQPIAAIRTNGGTALRWLDRSEPNIKKARDAINRILNDAGRASEVVTRIRGMVSGRPPEPAPVGLHDVIARALLFLQQEFQSKGVSVSLDLDPTLPEVRGDHTQLQQVIANLAINAVHALSKSEAQRRNISIRTHETDRKTVCCIIEDSGPGISPEHLPRLFDSFFTTKETGMGLGLPIVRSIVESHGGNIRADNNSALGGARFIFELPADDAPVE